MRFIFLSSVAFLSIFLVGCANVSIDNLGKQNKQTESQQEVIQKYSILEEVKIPIIIYHQVRDYLPKDSYSAREFIMSPKIFEEQMAFLAENNFNTIYPNDLKLYFEGKKDLPKKPIILTFDDGTLSQYENAFPVLKKYGFTATFYVFTHAMNKNDNYMNWEKLKEMAEAGMDIGSHTYLHAYLNRISLEKAQEEIERSFKDLKENLGSDPVSFSYPFGEYNNDIINIVEKTGFTTARGIFHGQTHASSSVFALHAYFAPNNLESFKKIVE